MPNVLDIGPVRAFARRVAAKIAEERVAARFERLALAELLRDERNFRAAGAADLEGAPAWARLASARGETVVAFRLHRGAAQSLHNFARRLDATRRLAALNLEQSEHNAVHISGAREFIDKLERADFATTRRKAYHYARLLPLCSERRDLMHVCAEQTIATAEGRRWVRVTSVSELRAVGREFRNCLARTTRTSAYGGGLYDGKRQFWVLRDARNNGLIVVMADAPKATRLMEVRGPRNTHVTPGCLDLFGLLRALGIRPPPPPPAPPPAAAAVYLRDLPCLCLLCSPAQPALRASAGAR